MKCRSLGIRRVATSFVCATLVILATTATPAVAGIVMLDFEGLQDLEEVLEFYNGGTGSNGSSGTDYGVSFSSNTLASIDEDAGGTGNFGGEPSPDTAMAFQVGSAATLNYAAGFDTGFSFYYSAIYDTGIVDVYDGLDATGTLLATVNLPLTTNNGAPDPTGEFSPFFPVGVAFAGTARSVDFGGAPAQVGFDNITFGREVPVGGVVPEPSSLAMFGIGALGLFGYSRRRRRQKSAAA